MMLSLEPKIFKLNYDAKAFKICYFYLKVIQISDFLKKFFLLSIIKNNENVWFKTIVFN